MTSAIDRCIEILGGLDGVQRHPALQEGRVDMLAKEHSIELPREHIDLLTWSDGLEAYDGYIRLFGLSADFVLNAVQWNKPEFWKFAWRSRASGFWCFGETAWGDQFAYSIESLGESTQPEVFFLDAISMSPERISNSFSEFIEEEFIRSALNPYDEMIRLAKDRFGPLQITHHLVYVPSLLVDPRESIDKVQLMDARAAMIINGDLATQVDQAPNGAMVKATEPYVDSKGRMRLRVLWS